MGVDQLVTGTVGGLRSRTELRALSRHQCPLLSCSMLGLH